MLGQYKILATGFAVFASIFTTATSTTYTPQCRCKATEPCWPSIAELDEFSKTLSSAQVLRTDIRPPASVCHGQDFRAAECEAAKKSWSNPFWRSEQIGAMQMPLFETQSIYSSNDTNLCDTATARNVTCEQGQTPTIGIAAQNEDDIVKGLDFARRHNLRVVVKSTGHDFYARSTAADSFLIWTHQIKHRAIQKDFVPVGCNHVTPSTVLRIGAGVQWNEAYQTARASHRVVVGGISANGTVGAAGGLLTGTGHSVLSPTFGLGVDNAIQLRVVLPSTGTSQRGYAGNKRVVYASKCSYPELYWALRGGGGNSFGVISEVVYRTHDDFTSLGAQISLSTPDADMANTLGAELLHAMGTVFFDQKWGGYSFIVPGVPGVSNYTISQLFLKPKVAFDSDDEKRYNETFSNLELRLRKISASPNPVGSIYRVASFGDVVDSLTAPTAHMRKRDGALGAADGKPKKNNTTPFGVSRLLPRSLFADRGKLVKYLDIVNGSTTLGHNVLGGQVSAVSPDSAAAHPGWRENAVHVISLPGTPISDEQVTAQRQMVTELAWGKSRAQQDVASYLNEQTPLDEYWPEAFYGSHWQRLSKIKRCVDPDDQLIVTKGVGSERWSLEGHCRLG